MKTWISRSPETEGKQGGGTGVSVPHAPRAGRSARHRGGRASCARAPRPSEGRGWLGEETGHAPCKRPLGGSPRGEVATTTGSRHRAAHVCLGGDAMLAPGNNDHCWNNDSRQTCEQTDARLTHVADMTHGTPARSARDTVPRQTGFTVYWDSIPPFFFLSMRYSKTRRSCRAGF